MTADAPADQPPAASPSPALTGSAALPALDRLRHLRDFIEVARQGSVAGASASLFKAASAISRAVRELESALGYSLFERKARGMLLNSFGQAVLGRALRIEEEVIAACDDITRSRRRQPADRSAVTSLLFNGRAVELLIALGETGALTLAARRVGLTQPGASMALARMEQLVGTTLFQRMLQGMVATDAGGQCLLRARRIMAELRHMPSDLAALDGQFAGHVTIGTLPLARTALLPLALSRVLARYPRIRMTTLDGPYEQLAAGLRDGDIDFIIGALRPAERPGDLITERLFDDQLGIIARAGHPRAGHPASLRDLLDEQWILPRPGAPGRRLIDLSFQALQIAPPRPSIEAGDLALIRGLLTGSNMLTAISPRQFQQEIAAGTLIELPVDLGRTIRQIGITMRRGALLPPSVAVILEEIRTAAEPFDVPPAGAIAGSSKRRSRPLTRQ